MSSPTASQKFKTWFFAAALHLFFALAALMGLATVNMAIGGLISGEQSLGACLAVGAFGAMFAAVGLGFFYITYLKAPLWAAQEKKLEARYPNQPWMLKSDWARRRVVHSSGGAALFLWIWVVGWWGAMALIWSVNRDKILDAVSNSYADAALTLLLPLAGLIGLAIAIQVTRTWRLYGRSELYIDTLPGFIGDVFRGYVRTRFPSMPKKPLAVKLVCERVTWVTTGSGKERSRERRTSLVWETTQEIAPSWLRVADGQVMIPLEVAIPRDLPECSSDDAGGGIEWSLSLEAAIDGAPAFSCAFDVPVFARR